MNVFSLRRRFSPADEFCSTENSARTTVAPAPSSSVAGLAAAGYRMEAVPNPATGRTLLHVTLPRAGHLSLAIFDLLGNHVATLADGYTEAGEGTYAFEPIAPGIYFARAQSGAFVGMSAVRIVR